MEPGQNDLLNVDGEQKLEQGLVQTQLQPMEVQVAMGTRQKLTTVMESDAQVHNTIHGNKKHINLKLF